jgi:DNA-binding beta-propeller fold protein YncE
MTRSIALLVLAGCGTMSDMGLEAAKSADSGGYSGGADEADGDVDADGDGYADTGASEQESDFLKLAPAATDAYVFVVNTERDTLTRITVDTLAVQTVGVGRGPSLVETTSDYATAVTFNAADDSVSIVDADTLSVTEVGVRDNFNSMDMSPDGAWVMCWYDPDRGTADDDDGGIQSFNEVSFVEVGTGTHWPMSVGFGPHGVRWSQDGTRAVVVSDASLAVIDLTAEELVPNGITIADDSVGAPEAEEVELAPDGNTAFVRQYGTDAILAVDLGTEVVTEISVGSNPTDLDVTPDELSLVVVSRGAREVWLLDVADPSLPATVLPFPEDVPYGSVLFTDADSAVLYTNASLEPSFAVWDVTAGSLETHALEKPVDTIGVTPDGAALLVFHTLEDDEDADPEGEFYGEWALTLIDLNDIDRQTPLKLPAEPSGYGTTDDGRFGFFIMEGTELLELLTFSTQLYTEIDLPSEPVWVGTLPGSDTAWASQEHELGRISFYDAAAGSLDTITGFELNSEIDHE